MLDRGVDGCDHLSGPVDGSDAVEGVTIALPRTWVNEHLPSRPEPTAVYALDSRLARVPAEPS
ncbi:hypothetical protein [Streptomyces xylophagus]|uniref:hypothetical protein n=1 Tax=Streptomyces xylophagus TaxID=285514 RepID=UPI0005BE9DC0|nr:hypothetical protein [Streptomyces xylophagus]